MTRKVEKQPYIPPKGWRSGEAFHVASHLITEVLEQNGIESSDYEMRSNIASMIIDGVVEVYASLDELDTQEKRTVIEGELGEVFSKNNVTDAQVIAEIFDLIITQLEKEQE